MEDLDIDDIDKLEELLAAENSSEDELDSSKIPLKKDSSFLQDVVESEANLLAGKENKLGKVDARQPNCSNNAKSTNSKGNSFIHNGDTDSSDDEEKKNFMERKYSDYGLGIKKVLQEKEESQHYKNIEYSNESKKVQNSSFKKNISTTASTTKPDKNVDVYFDPVFGIRIIRPLISGAQLKERMQGREAISMSRIKRHIANIDKCKDWVVAGAIVRKSATQESKKGAQYCIWTLSDLKDDLKTVSVFLFHKAYKELWKTAQGSVVGILNPSVLDKRDGSGDEACLSVDNPDRVMLMGTSKDFGFCKSKKNNGDPCTTFVNMNQCEYCIYHVKQQYKKCSNSRSELQSKISGRGLMDLQNKLLGKNTVIYGGKAYTAIPATKSIKQTKKDATRMRSLSDYFTNTSQSAPAEKITSTPPILKNARRVEASVSQRLKDMKRLEFLQAGTSKSQSVLKMEKNMESPKNVDSKLSPIPAKPTVENNTTRKVPTLGIPMLGFGLKKSSPIDLSTPITSRHAERAKLNALKWIRQNGPLKKNNPHNLKGTEEGKKRNLNKLNASLEENDPSPKKPKTGVRSENFQKMLAATSAHSDLIVEHDDSEADKYFDKLEKKEKMEEKMLSTYKVACKAVRCLKCSYTSFSAADRCKKEKHPLKVFDAMKRFFKCSHCSNRVVSLEIIPTQSCKNCQRSSWQRTGMMAEKKGLTIASKLSITGGEDFLGHVDHGADINLLVPEDFK